MQEYEYLFSNTLHEKLKEKIKGKIFCKVIDDILIVDIDTRENIDFGYTVSDFAEKNENRRNHSGNYRGRDLCKIQEKSYKHVFLELMNYGLKP